MSNINYSEIDQTFPKAGQDNDSQGFRDNFASIRTGLQTANAEISELQTKAILSAPIGSSTDPVVNDLQSSTIAHGSYKDFNTEIYNHLPGFQIDVDPKDGAYQIITLSGESNTITLDNWPQESALSNGICTRVVLEIVCGSGRSFANFAFSPTGGVMKFVGGIPTFTVGKDTNTVAIPKVFEVWSWDQGQNVYIRFLGEFLNGTDPVPDYTFNGDVTLSKSTAVLDVPLGEVSASIITAVTTANLRNTTAYDLNVTNGTLLNAVTVNGAVEINNTVSIDSSLTVTGNATFGDLATTASADIISFDGVPRLPTVNGNDVNDGTGSLSTIKETGMLVFSSVHNSLEICQNDQSWGVVSTTSVEQLTTGSAVSLSKSASWFSTVGPSTATLAAGYEGQIKTFAITAHSDNMVITLGVGLAGWGGARTMTFNDVGDGCTLQFLNGKWYCIGNNGVVFS